MTLPIDVDLTKEPGRPIGPVCFYTSESVDARLTQLEKSSGLSRSELLHRLVAAMVTPAESGAGSARASVAPARKAGR